MNRRTVSRRTVVVMTGAVLALGALAGCSSGSGSSGGSAGSAGGTAGAVPAGGDALGYGAGGAGAVGSAPASPGAPAAAAGSSALATASTSLGTIVVDGKGMTAYFYDKDPAGAMTSTCTGQCAALWPEITTTSAHPTVTGVTGTVGTIPGVDGAKQLTLDGHPLYTYAADTKAGDTNGQGFGGVWWVVAPDGTEIGK